MKSGVIIVLILIPLLIGGSLYILNGVVGPMTRGNPIGLFGNTSSIWFTIIPGGIGLCGLFLALIMAPLLFRNSLINWKENNSSWKWQLPLILFVGGVGTFMTFPLEYLALLTIPLCLIVFGISLLVTLIMAARVNARSAFFWILMGFTVITGGVVAFVFYSFSNLSLCYCPVNRKSSTKDILLKPLYNYRKNQLRNRLNI